MRRSIAIALALGLACVDEPEYEGRRCFSNEPCPTAYACGADEKCHRADASDAGAADAAAGDASVDPARCAEPIAYPADAWEARYYYLPQDHEIVETDCFGVETLAGDELHKNFGFEGPTPEVLTFASRFTATRSFVGLVELTIFHDDGLRILANEVSVYDHYRGPINGPVKVNHYFARGDYQLRVDHWDGQGTADIELAWKNLCQLPPQPPRNGWALSFYRVDAMNIDGADCFGTASVSTSTIALSYAEAPQKVRDGGVLDGYVIVARARRTFTGATTFSIAHDDGLRFFADDLALYEDLAPGASRSTNISASLDGEHELRIEAYDFSGGVSASLSW